MEEEYNLTKYFKQFKEEINVFQVLLTERSNYYSF